MAVVHRVHVNAHYFTHNIVPCTLRVEFLRGFDGRQSGDFHIHESLTEISAAKQVETIVSGNAVYRAVWDLAWWQSFNPGVQTPPMIGILRVDVGVMTADLLQHVPLSDQVLKDSAVHEAEVQWLWYGAKNMND